MEPPQWRKGGRGEGEQEKSSGGRQIPSQFELNNALTGRPLPLPLSFRPLLRPAVVGAHGDSVAACSALAEHSLADLSTSAFESARSRDLPWAK